jgi:hypothetical protein
MAAFTGLISLDKILVTGGYFNRFVLRESNRENVIYRPTVGSILNS